MTSPRKLLIVSYDATELTGDQRASLRHWSLAAAEEYGDAQDEDHHPAVAAWSTYVDAPGTVEIEVDPNGSARPRGAGGWSVQQVKSFARRFATTHRPAWHACVPEVREALVDRFVLQVVLGQDRHAVAVSEIQSLRSRLVAALHLYQKLTVDPLDAPDAGEVTP